MRTRLSALVTMAMAASGCADDFRISSMEVPTGGAGASGTAVTSRRMLRVPDDYSTIQLAVTAAESGDLVLISAGVYEESISVGTPSLVIRGADRNAVIVDGGAIRPVGFDVTADGVAIENLSVRNHTGAGIRWRGVTGFRARFITASNNADHGIAAVASRDGLIEDTYASGSAEAGVAIARCDSCSVAVRRVIAMHNAIGLLAVDANGPLEVRGGIWRHNRSGVVIASDRAVHESGQRGVSIVENLIDGNVSRTAPYSLPAGLAWGNGVTVMGGSENTVQGNHITAQAGNGVLVVPSAQRPFGGEATRNVVTGNVLAQSGRADLSIGGPAASANCVGANVGSTRLAPSRLGCRDGNAIGTQSDLVPWMATVIRGVRLERATSPGWREQPAPPTQPAMPDVDDPVTPAVGVFASYLTSRVASDLPAVADSMSRDALARGGLPIHTSARGVAVMRLQAAMPFTLPRLGSVLVLLVACGFAIRAAQNRAKRWVRGAWALAVFTTIAWVGLACVAAFALSEM